MSQWPQASGLLSLSFDEIIVPGNLRVVGSSAMPFTQALALFRGQLADVAAMEQVAFKSLSAGDVVVLEVMLKVGKTSSLALLARTPAGWFRAEREVKVGRPA